ncbi:MAG TPA: LamG domain-containing protein [Victivallis vadensis]|nr:LamG domain-containing protein [Victivallis vadensis]
MPCEDYKDHSQYLRTVIQASGNSIAIDVSDKKFGAASLHGNGSNRAGVIAELPVAPFAADTTVHAWVKITDADDRCGIFDTYGAADGGSGDPGKGVGGIALWTHQGKLKAYKASAHFSSYWYDDDSGNLLVEADLPSDYLNRWMHVALVRSGLNWILFVDGVKLAENIKDFTPDKKFIRLAQHQSDAMTGNLDEFIILDYARWITDFEPPAQPATTLTRSYEISDKAPIAVEAPADGELLIGQGGKFVKITLAELKARLNALS